MHRAEDVEKVLRKFAIEDVWGIGRRHAPRLREAGIISAYDFTQLSEERVRAKMGITGVRTWRELRGIPSIEFEHSIEAKQSICVSRSFSSEIYNREELMEQVAKFAAMTAEKLRDQKSMCRQLSVFAATNRFHSDETQQYGNIITPFTEPTNSTLHLVRAAREAAKAETERNLRVYFALQEIARREMITASDNEMLDAISNMASQAREKNIKGFIRKLQRENRMTGIRLSIITSKVIDLLARNAKVTISQPEA